MSNAKMEYKGIDIDDAISNACASLKVPREELEIEIVSTGSVGIFGLGKKKAVIRVSRRGAAA
ncbi:MAG: Jag N-terminal domain-containing protein, partial [Thermodesulfobacteriota bacterium]